MPPVFFLIFSLFFHASILAGDPGEEKTLLIDRKIMTEDDLELIISHDEILKHVKNMAEILNRDYEGKEVVIVMIMKGAFIFVADLIREMNDPVAVESIRCTSFYGGLHRKELKVHGLEKLNLKGKHVLLVDDIYDSGNTLNQVVNSMKDMGCASLKTLVLLKKEVERDASFPDPDYVVFNLKNVFVVGYGLDYNEHYRGLKGIYGVPLD